MKRELTEAVNRDRMLKSINQENYMRTLTVMEMDAVSGGGNTRVQNLGQCFMDVATHGAAGGAVGVLLGGPIGGKVGIAAGMISAIIGSDACVAALG